MGLFDYPADAGTRSRTDAAPHFTFLEHLSTKGWKTLLTHAETVQFSAGQVVVTAGDADEAFYIVTAGSVDVVVPGTGETLTTIPEGSVFGEISFFDGQPRSASIRASTDGSAIRLTRDGFERLSGWDPVLGRQILMDLGKILALRLRWTTGLARR